MIGDPAVNEPDVVLVGAGIMSATLAVCLKELEPALNIEMFETLGGPALESSNAWNNAGTGHAANCELNYTPERSDGSIDISALLLLQKSGIPEGKGYGGFPVGGIWLRCDDPEINKRHHAKVYGKASVGSPPMSVPHLDTRVIGGKHSFCSALCRLLDQVSQARLAARSLPLHQPRQYRAFAGGWARQFRLDQISDRSGSPDGATPVCRAEGILSGSEAGGLAAGGRGTTGSDHQAIQARRFLKHTAIHGQPAFSRREPKGIREVDTRYGLTWPLPTSAGAVSTVARPGPEDQRFTRTGTSTGTAR